MTTGLWHHYVPQMYLRAFVDPAEAAKGQNVLWSYKVGFKPKRMATRSVAAASGFYHTPEVRGAENETEQALGEIETVASAHLRNLREGNMIHSAQAKAEFAGFIGLTIMRTALARERANKIAVELFRQGVEKSLREGGVDKLMADFKENTGNELTKSPEKFAALASGIANGSVDLIQPSKAWNIKQMFERGLELGAIVRRMRWVLLEAPRDNVYITCDNPVNVNDPARVLGRTEFRVSDDLQMFFPLSPQFLLYGDFKGSSDDRGQIDPAKVAIMNRTQLEQANEQVYASFRSDDLQVLMEKIFKEREPLIPNLPKDMLD